jgi:hypothetical protein
VAGGDERDELVAQVSVGQRVPVRVSRTDEHRKDIAALGEPRVGAGARDVRAEQLAHPVNPREGRLADRVPPRSAAERCGEEQRKFAQRRVERLEDGGELGLEV